MSKIEICPVCKGTGKIFENGYAYINKKKVCHGCDGKGWIQLK